MTKITMAQVADELGVTEKDPRKREVAAIARLTALGYKEECSRCGGTGSYSYCQTYGTRCFKCGGSKLQVPTVTRAMLDAAVARQAAGELDGYFAAIKQRAEMKKQLKPLLAAIETEWCKGAIHAEFGKYSHMSTTRFPPDDVSRAANMINRVWTWTQRINEVGCKMDIAERLAVATEGLQMLRHLNVLWAEYRAANPVTEDMCRRELSNG